MKSDNIGAVERVVIDGDSPWGAEHFSRYRFAAELAAGRRVLDVACGTGYGGPVLLEGGASTVVGVDLSFDAVMIAGRIRPEGLSLCQADATALPMAPGSFDMVTSFETLEHIPEHERFVAEIRRVLAPGGLLVLSTPNALHSRPVAGVPRNPFHVREFTRQELQVLLGEHFAKVEVLGQRTTAEYGNCAYWELDENLPKRFEDRAKVVLWKLLARLPSRIRELGSQLILARSFYPGVEDFEFGIRDLDGAHALLAICEVEP